MIEVIVTTDGATNLYPLLRPFWGRIRFIQRVKPLVRGCVYKPDEYTGNPVAEIGDKRTLQIPFIDVKTLTPEQVGHELLGLLPENDGGPGLKDMIVSFSGDMTKWAAAKFAFASKEEVERRLALCRDCEWWDAQALRGTGRCRRCGCSTWAKIRLETSSCPIGKWNRIGVEELEKRVTVVNTVS